MKQAEPATLVEVAVAAPVFKLFTYSVPTDLGLALQPGHLVEVPFGRSKKRGVVVGVGSAGLSPEKKIKPILSVVDTTPVLSQTLMDTLIWAAHYYLAPLGEMIFTALPPACRKQGSPLKEKERLVAFLKPDHKADPSSPAFPRSPVQKEIFSALSQAGQMEVAELARKFKGARAALSALQKKGFVEMNWLSKRRKPKASTFPKGPPISCMTQEQDEALTSIQQALDCSEYRAFLLHGITGSGKTEVYLRAIAYALALGREAILLVPEISLTPQLLARVSERFADNVAVLHSGLNQGERLDEWRRLRDGTARVAVGARSAVFAPLKSPGIFVVDEEHDSSYKQSERLPYNGRDLAMVRAQREGAVVLLGTATPSLESYTHAKAGRSQLLELKTRIHSGAAPSVEVVDLKQSLLDPLERVHTLSPRLAECLAQTLDRKEQAILFLNRRGYSSFALCKECGQSIKCLNCSVALVHHLKEGLLRCHYCGLAIGVPKSCPNCEKGRIRLFGLGTEKCEEEVLRRFPGVRVLRMDSDSTNRRGSAHEMISAFAHGEADVLVGTQMVTKGHDIPKVTLVGVLLADLGLALPDFRSSERTFQLLVQVTGRAGRRNYPGKVVIQTLLPENETIELATTSKFQTFFERESHRRSRLGYPPSKRLLLIRVSDPDPEVCAHTARQVSESIRKALGKNIEILGPVVSPLARLRGRYRWQMLLKSPNVGNLYQSFLSVQKNVRHSKQTKIFFDVDPIDML